MIISFDGVIRSLHGLSKAGKHADTGIPVLMVLLLQPKTNWHSNGVHILSRPFIKSGKQ